MSLSFNEIEAIALKAIRGAGASWGLAEEAAFAARWLAERDIDWAGAILARCEAPVSDEITFDPAALRGSRLCPLRTGAFLADAGVPAALAISEIASPVLLLPFLARAEATAPLCVRIETSAPLWIASGHLHTRGGSLTIPASAAVAITTAQLPDDAAPVPCLRRPRPVAADALQALSAFERRTYVPATAQSRLAGAGAGLSDND